jgi:hypothetical protein
LFRIIPCLMLLYKPCSWESIVKLKTILKIQLILWVGSIFLAWFSFCPVCLATCLNISGLLQGQFKFYPECSLVLSFSVDYELILKIPGHICTAYIFIHMMISGATVQTGPWPSVTDFMIVL